jgi:Mn-dependent DtxR family transcriptional regulator
MVGCDQWQALRFDPPAAAESDAEGIEHHVSRDTLAAFVKYLAARE